MTAEELEARVLALPSDDLRRVFAASWSNLGKRLGLAYLHAALTHEPVRLESVGPLPVIAIIHDILRDGAKDVRGDASGATVRMFVRDHGGTVSVCFRRLSLSVGHVE